MVFFANGPETEDHGTRNPSIGKILTYQGRKSKTSALNALPTKTFSAKHRISVLEYLPDPPHLPDLAPLTRGENKSQECIERNTCSKRKSDRGEDAISEDDTEHCFQAWKTYLER
ncbi:hypothetical protein J437_LFUL006101 [Ladona fulva]|uniref:Uncharacterized protein n=1 Tax=Ladona fulva TaxID=123851 RepID=A0A8K0K7Z7_LADFU|nr:hypothetical protein J437_LFUL006101 [Ladona fulva]